MTTVISGSSPSITFSDSTTQTTAFTSTPSITTITTSSDASISGLTVGKGGGAISTSTAVGVSALNSNTTGAFNSAFGSGSLQANITASNSTAIGYQSLKSNTASNSTAVGFQSSYNNTSGTWNVVMGIQALYTNTAGGGNTVIGHQAGYTHNPTNAGDGYQTLIGFKAGNKLTTGIGNTFVGASNTNGTGAGFAVTTGSNNTILGGYSGNQNSLDIRTASNYIVLSDGDGNIAYSSSTSGTPYFSLNGTNADGQLGTTVTKTTLSANLNDGIRVNQIGTSYWNGPTGGVINFRASGTTTGNISQTSSTTSYNGTSDYRLKENIAPLTGALATVSQLKPVTFTWKGDNQNDNGFIAHELQEVLPNAVTGQKDAVNSEGNPIYQGIDPRNIVATLTAALQELKQIVDTQAAEIAELKAKVGI